MPELFEHLMKKENVFCTKIAMSNSPNSDLVTDFPQAGGQILSSQITTSSGRVVSKVMGGPKVSSKSKSLVPLFLLTLVMIRATGAQN